MKYIYRFIKPYKKYIFLLLFFNVLEYINPMISPLLTKILVDDVFTKKSHFWHLGNVLFLMLALSMFTILIQYIEGKMSNFVGVTMIKDLRKTLYAHIQYQSMDFFDNRKTGSISGRITQDANSIQQIINNGIVQLILQSMLGISMVAVLFYMNWKLALFACIVIPLYYVIYINTTIHVRRAFRNYRAQFRTMSGFLTEKMGAIKIIQSFSQEEKEIAQFDQLSNDLSKKQVHSYFLSNIVSSLSQTFTNVGGVIIWFFGGKMVLEGTMSLGELLAFQAYLGQLYGPVRALLSSNNGVQDSVASLESIYEILDHPSAIQDKENATVLPEIKGNIEFKHVSFSYETKKLTEEEMEQEEKKFYVFPPKKKQVVKKETIETNPVLYDVNIRIKQGEKIALVGPSGGGKTTFVHLIPRLYDVNKGELLIDGINVKDIKMKNVRENIAFVMQDNILFSGTILENITYGKEQATKEEVIQCAKMANAYEFIEKMSDGLDTIIGERGVRLSGGQKQRIAIARAILTNPKILILDEATSALDSESEELITEALDRVTKDKTTFVIAHRLATVVNADKILVIEEGKIVEEGTHEELIQRNGKYNNLYKKQLKAMKA